MYRFRGSSLLVVVTIISMTIGIMSCDGGQPRVSIENARAEMSPAMYDEGIIYLKIVNLGGKDTLIDIRTNIPGAAPGLHEMKGNFMVLAKSLQIPAKNTVDLVPMGTHIMIENMPKEVSVGYRFTLTLMFKRSGDIQIPLTLMKAQPMMHEHEHRE
jgi:copper(I)-binding protein